MSLDARIFNPIREKRDPVSSKDSFNESSSRPLSSSRYHPISVSSDEEELEFTSQTQAEPSFGQRAGEVLRRGVKKVQAFFARNPEKVDRSDCEEIPDVPHRRFDDFLAVKAKDGFSAKEKLAMRGIEFITAEGLGNKVKAFFALGGIGYFFAGKVTSENRDALMNEARFYRQCCKVQVAYQKFSKKPDTANFSGLKTAYEAVLAMGKNETDHDNINLIVNKHFAKGSPVGEAILSHEAKTSLTSLDGFTADSIMETITGVEFLEGISAKSHMGYRGRDLTSKEESVITTAKRKLIQQPEITSILDDKSAKSIFLSYARVFNQLRDSEEAYSVCSDVVEALGSSTVTKGQIDRRVAGYNALLLDLVQNPDKTVSSSMLPQVAQEALDEMTKMYGTLQENLAKQPQLMVDQKAALDAQKKADAALQKEGAKTRSFTLAELEEIFREKPNQLLPGAEDYLVAEQQKKTFAALLEAQNKGIQDRKEGLAAYITGLEMEASQFAEKIAEQQAIIDENAKKLNSLGQEVSKLGKRRIKKHEAITGSKAVPDITAAYSLINAAEDRLDQLEPEHEAVVNKLATARAEWTLLNKNSAAHPAIKARDSSAKSLAAVEARRFNLTHAQIMEIYADNDTFAIDALEPIEERMQALQSAKEAKDELVEQCNDELETVQNAIRFSIASLQSVGFEVSDRGVVGTLNFTGFDESFRQAEEEKIAQQGPLSGRIVLALQAVASTPKEMNLRTVLDTESHVPVEVERSSSDTFGHPMIIRASRQTRTETEFVPSAPPASHRRSVDPMKRPESLVMPPSQVTDLTDLEDVDL